MNKLIPVISLLAVLMATAIFLTQSDDSEAVSTVNATHLEGSVTCGSSSVGLVTFVTSDDTTTSVLSYRIVVSGMNSQININNSSYTLSTAPFTTGTVYWEWDSSDYTNISVRVEQYGTTLLDTAVPITSSTSGLSGGVKTVSVDATGGGRAITVTNVDFPTVTTSGTGNIADWDCRVTYYTVTFADNGYGSVDATTVTVPQGSTIWSDGATVKIQPPDSGLQTYTATPLPNDADFRYSFSNWTGVTSTATTISSDMTVTANFNREDNVFIVAISSSNTTYGTVDRDILTTVPYDTPYSVSGDKLTIGSTVITATPTPTVEGDQYLYSFSGWSVSSGTVTDNMSIVANFEQTVREYTVTINVNNPSYGTVNKNSVTVPYGSTMVVSGVGLYIGNTIVTTTPTPATIDTNYWFGRWTFPPGNPSGSEITHDITVTANFESGVRYYEITFVTLPDGYGTLDIDYAYSTSNGYHASYGSAISVSGNVLTIDGERDITATATPSAQEVDWTYSFDNWTVSSSTVTGDMTINANFTRTANTVVNVTVSTPQGHFYEGGNEYTSHVFRVPIPSTVSQDTETGTLHLWNYEITADMTVLTEQYEYTFFIWDGVPVGEGSVSDGMNISAIYHSEDRYYEVNFSIADGFGTLTTERVLVLYNTLIYSENNVVVVGANTITATPTENGEDVTYEFVRWDGLPMSGRILEDTDISAKIQRTVTADAFNIVEIEHGEVERVWSIPDEYLPLMLVIPIMLLIGMVLLSLNRKSDGDDYESY